MPTTLPQRLLLALAVVASVPATVRAAGGPVPCVREPSTGTHVALRGAALSTLADIFALNYQLKAAGRPALPHALVTYGMDAVATRRWLVIGGAADAVAERSVANARYAAATGGTLDEGIAGVALVCTSSWSVYPLAGIGTTRLDISIASRQASTTDTVLAVGAAGGALSSRTWFDDYGLGVDFRGRGDAASRLSAGMRVGYVERFGAAHWRLSGQRVAGGPKFGLSGPYLRASLGLGF